MHYSKNYEIIFSDLIKDSIRETMDMALSHFLIKQRPCTWKGYHSIYAFFNFKSKLIT